ncbi:MAG TPA: 3-hydroxyacyl-CoA dehydrogenase/enoyl-CoA hydratase family protein [Vicinamibacterales bacterium]|nr:3-hydroxyacyl-CoA dehydrogenase/enoyl-CoA hydratase family protein [Vicinamibacterales bacterium]
MRQVMVLGAGTMGAQIAAHAANSGLQVVLADVTAEAAEHGRRGLTGLSPSPVFVPEVTNRITVTGFDDLSAARNADWVIEAVVESLDAKRALISRLEPALGPDTIVSSNTSALSIAAIAAGRSPDFRRRWLGTHFFNPPRYMPLVELIATPETDAAIVARLSAFLDRRLGKGVVFARDTPGFIANRIGIFGALRAIDALASGRFTIEEIDAMTGTIIGRPKSATFRTLDVAGLDVFARVAADLRARLGAEFGSDAPGLLREMIARGQLGEKTGAGFYKRVKSAAGSTILALDISTGDYRPLRPVTLPALDAAAAIAETGARIRALLKDEGRVGEFLRQTLGATIDYARRIAPEIADAADDIDQAMKWGFGWELGPFEIHTESPQQHAETPSSSRRRENGRLLLHASRQARGVVRSNAGASLIDLGDGALAVEFHSKMNTIGGDALAMLEDGVSEAAANFRALVVGSEAELFSAGANLMLLLLEAQEGNWDEVDAMVRAFQRATMALKTAAVPVVAAPAGLALGGGCEICLHADRVQAAAETYIGLVEVGVGLIPAGGGSKEMTIRASDRAAGGDGDAAMQAAFETIALGKVSTSALDARRLGYLRDTDGMSMNRERVIADAKAAALARAETGYQPPLPRAAIRVGGADLYARLALGVDLAHRAGRATDHDALVGRKLAWVMTGGSIPHAATVSEQHLLDLEREAFLSLCGETETLRKMSGALVNKRPGRIS